MTPQHAYLLDVATFQFCRSNQDARVLRQTENNVMIAKGNLMTGRALLAVVSLIPMMAFRRKSTPPTWWLRIVMKGVQLFEITVDSDGMIQIEKVN